MADTTVAQTIVEQLGGNRFRAMTGVKRFVAEENGVSFHLPKEFAAKDINFVRIELSPLDLYTITFSTVRNLTLTEVAKHEMVYAEDLQKLFTAETGLYTRL